MTNPQRLVHLAIDVQPEYYCRLDHPRRTDFPRDVRKFADNLRLHGVPTIWVTLLPWRSPAIHPPEAIFPDGRRRGDEFVERLELGAVKPLMDEAVLVKRRAGAFDDGYLPDEEEPDGASCLESYLRELGADALVITGINTGVCVADTVEGATSRGFPCHVMTDLLADRRAAQQGVDGDHSWHRQKLREASPSPLVTFSTSLEFLHSLIGKPVRPRRYAQVAVSAENRPG